MTMAHLRFEHTFSVSVPSELSSDGSYFEVGLNIQVPRRFTFFVQDAGSPPITFWDVAELAEIEDLWLC